MQISRPIMSSSTLRVAGMVASLLTLFVLSGAGGCAHLAALDSGALWQIVGNQCVPDARDTGRAAPCASVDLARRDAVLKDISSHTQYLLIPTDRVSGIESPEILYAGAPEYWADAWAARRYVNAKLKTPLADDRLGLEINAVSERSQNQLHIHVDCMREDVISALAPYRHDAPDAWHTAELNGRRYRIMRIMQLDERNNPFRVVARSLPDAGPHDRQQGMAAQTIFVTGAGADAGHDGWLLVNSSMGWQDGTGSAERLLDHTCGLARAPRR